MDRTNIYVMKLEDACYYVGKSRYVDKRIMDHVTGNGSAWTQRHLPIEVVNIYKDMSPFDEDRITKELMAQYGIDKVRGGSYVSLELDATTQEMLTKEIRMAQDRCLRCGREGHFITTCYAKADVHGNRLDKELKRHDTKADVHGNRLDKEPRKQVDKLHCDRCGRDTHTSAKCYAKIHIDGHRLDGVDQRDDKYASSNPSTAPSRLGAAVGIGIGVAKIAEEGCVIS